MEVKISNLFKLNEDCKSYHPTHVISILDPKIKMNFIPKFCDDVKLLQLFFYDIDDMDKQNVPIINYIRSIIDFLNGFIRLSKTPKRLLVHCHAGASRSPAIVYILFSMIEKNTIIAFHKLLKISNKPWPNRQLVELADIVLEKNGMMLLPLDEYRHSNPYRSAAYEKLNIKRNLKQFVE